MFCTIEFVSHVGLICRILNIGNPNTAWQAVQECNRRVACLSLGRIAHLRILRLCSARKHRSRRWRRQRCPRDVYAKPTSPTQARPRKTHAHTHGYKRTKAAECPVLSRVVVSVLDKHSERHVRAPACALLVSIHCVCCACACVCVSASASASASACVFVFVCVPVCRKPERAANSRSVANLCCNRRYIVQKVVKLQIQEQEQQQQYQHQHQQQQQQQEQQQTLRGPRMCGAAPFQLSKVS